VTLQLVKKFPAFMEPKSPLPYPQMLDSWVILNMWFLRRGVVSTLPNHQAGGPPLIGYPRLLIQFIHSYPPYRGPFLHPQPEDAPCRGDRDPHPVTQKCQILSCDTLVTNEQFCVRTIVGLNLSLHGKKPATNYFR
jgi:hypothetical protein